MILLLIIFLFPGFILAEEASGKALESEQAIEEKPAAESKESEQKQEKYGITGEVAAPGRKRRFNDRFSAREVVSPWIEDAGHCSPRHCASPQTAEEPAVSCHTEHVRAAVPHYRTS